MAGITMLCFAILSAFIALTAAQVVLPTKDRCASKGIFTYGRCPEVVEDFSLGLFDRCAAIVQFGCVLEPSPSAPGKFSCTFKPERVLAANTVCPGDKVVFDRINIKETNILSVFTDLNAAPILTDFYLLTDATGSMKRAIADVKSKFKEIVAEFDSDQTDAQFGVGFYKDELELTNGFKNAQAITDNIKLVNRAITDLNARGGIDYPEANLAALYQVATSDSIGWRPNSRRVVVYVGDQPGHEPSCVGGNTLTRTNVGEALIDSRITVVGITFGAKNLDGATTPYTCGGAGAGNGQATHLTSVTDGVLAVAGSEKKIVATIRGALKNLKRKFNVDESDCAEKITSTFNPTNPWFVLPGDSTTMKHTMVLNDRACAGGNSFECKFKFDDFGGELPGTTVAFTNMIGCSP